jgi:hypothetical protein
MLQSKIFIALLALSMLSLNSCKKDDDNSSSTTSVEVNNIVSSGNWRVTYYWDTDKDETSDFSGYTFTFGVSGVLTALKNGTTITGTWGTRIDSGKTKLDIAFATPESFREITEDWEVLEKSATQIKLIHVSGGNGGTDYITFQKN